MGLISGLLGHAAEVAADDVAAAVAGVLVPGEQVRRGFRLVRDLIVFTDRRLIFVDKQGLTGKKVEYLSVPYKSVTRFSVETGGHFDLDSELRVWVTGSGEPVKKEFKKGEAIQEVQRTLAEFVLG